MYAVRISKYTGTHMLFLPNQLLLLPKNKERHMGPAIAVSSPVVSKLQDTSHRLQTADGTTVGRPAADGLVATATSGG